MDSRLDSIARQMATRISRRTLFAVTGFGLIAASVDESAARGRRRNGRRRTKSAACPIDRQCGTACCDAGAYCIDIPAAKCGRDGQVG